MADSLKEEIRSFPDSSFLVDTYYYISENGNDDNDGRTPETAWKSTVKILQMQGAFKPGTAFLFERGGTYRGWLVLNNGCFYGAYGTGAKPRLYASLQNYAVPALWKKNETDLWVCEVRDFIGQPMSDIGQVNCDEGAVVGFKKMSLEEVRENEDFYYNGKTGKLYFKYPENPGSVFGEIELCPKFHVMSGYGVQDVVIENLDIRYTGSHGIALGCGTDRITIRGCEFGWIGGSILMGTLRFGNAVELWENGTDLTVENCYIYECYDTALTHQGDHSRQIGIRFCNNLIENCCYGIEFFAREPEDSILKDVLYKGNIIRNTGYGWGKQRPNPEANSAVCGWWFRNVSKNFVIEENIFENSDWYLVYFSDPHGDGVDITFRDNAYYQDDCGEHCATAYWQDKTVYRAVSGKEFEQQVRLMDETPRIARFYKDGKEL